MNKAHCDVTTGKIFGCKKGSWMWFHEKGHLVFNSLDKTSWLLMIKTYIFEVWMLFVMAAIVFKSWVYTIAVLLWLGYVSIGLYEEHWCNQYANRNYKQTHRNGSKKKRR